VLSNNNRSKKILTYVISSFLDRRSSSRSMESTSTTRHPTNAWKKRIVGRAISFRPKKSLENDKIGGVSRGFDEGHTRREILAGRIDWGCRADAWIRRECLPLGGSEHWALNARSGGLSGTLATNPAGSRPSVAASGRNSCSQSVT
jgi:hypothetical protein